MLRLLLPRRNKWHAKHNYQTEARQLAPMVSPGSVREPRNYPRAAADNDLSVASRVINERPQGMLRQARGFLGHIVKTSPELPY